ncbi:MAG: peptidoglycan editing factor PgeF [Simkania negevensis]|nr:peptidoglycan editing factor PgeF [Simkania negevensis]
MIRREKNGIEWLEFELLQPYKELRHATFLRTGNFDLKKEENQEKALALLGASRGVGLRQVHRDQILHVRERKLLGWYLEENFDALTTQEEGLALMIRHADCQAAIFFDPVNKAVANVHCGWRGSVKNIYKKVIDKMKALFGSEAADLIVCISPSLGPESAQFIHYREELPPHFWPFQKKELYFDFWEISRFQLEAEGIKKIEVAGLCSKQNEKDFFSYRRKEEGNNATLIALSNCT